MILRRTLLLAILLVAWPSGLAEAAPFDQLLTRVPAGANVLVLIDVETTLAAPIAQEKGWGKQLELSYVERPIFLPPESTKLVMAASLRSGDNFSRLWEMAAMEVAESMSMRSIARSEGGYVDEINGVTTAWTPSDAYFVSLSDRELGVMFPAERQFVSRWIDFTQNNHQILISDYLKASVQLANTKVPILLAIDLKDVVQPHEMEQRLQESPEVKQAGLSIPEAAAVLASLRGAVLRVAVGKDVQGQLRIDFDKPISAIQGIAKELVINALDNLGAHVEDLADWKLELEEKAITMRGPLSTDGQRRVFSVIEIPSTKFSTLKDAKQEGGEETPESLIREASLTYYRATDVLIADLRRDLRGNKASSAVMERYARKIDRMPILHVDPDLLDYGSQLAQTLREMALAKREGGIQAGTQTAGMGAGRYGGSYSGYNDGYLGTLAYGSGDRLYAAKESAADRSAIKANAMAASSQMRVEGFKLIDDHNAAIRRQMTEKYGVEF
ncbi:MAG: hypothetical protein KDA57_01680 [Planctomycetales bacterium]|nr:hypothetical protein [Planctomycetales bacterium]